MVTTAKRMGCTSSLPDTGQIHGDSVFHVQDGFGMSHGQSRPAQGWARCCPGCRVLGSRMNLGCLQAVTIPYPRWIWDVLWPLQTCLQAVTIPWFRDVSRPLQTRSGWCSPGCQCFRFQVNLGCLHAVTIPWFWDVSRPLQARSGPAPAAIVVCSAAPRPQPRTAAVGNTKSMELLGRAALIIENRQPGLVLNYSKNTSCLFSPCLSHRLISQSLPKPNFLFQHQVIPFMTGNRIPIRVSDNLLVSGYGLHCTSQGEKCNSNFLFSSRERSHIWSWSGSDCYCVKQPQILLVRQFFQF